MVIVTADGRSKRRRPALSTMMDDTNTEITCITPTIMVATPLSMPVLAASKISFV